MIKVNLLRGHRAPAAKPTSVRRRSRMGLVLTAVFTVILFGLGTSRYYLGKQVRLLEERRDTLRAENERLHQLRKQIAELEKVKRLRQSRLDIVEKLKQAQTGPVLLLNHVFRSLPREAVLWLTLLDHKADRVQIKGHATRRESIPDFMSNLSQSGYFRTVDLELIEVDENGARFSLVCTLPGRIPTE